jgi:hypothetical protein
VGYIGIATGTISGIGYALYSWAHDVPVALALWNGFALFLKMFFGGLLSLIVGYVLVKVSD